MIASTAQRPMVPRLFAGALALALALGQVAAAAHFALVRHATCLDHGLAVHVGAESGHAHHPKTSSPAWVEGDDSSDHGHEHCAVAAVRRDAPAEVGAPRSATLCARGPLAAMPERAGAPGSDAVWRLAPKQSPPTA